MSIPKDIIKEQKGLGEWNILSFYRGSVSHGMYVPNSDPNSIDDKDAMAVCVPPKDYYYGLKKYGSRGTKEIKRGEWDIVIYEARKYISLLEKGNPNVVSSLWLDDVYYLNITPAGRLILDSRELFSAKHLYRSFIGYAHGQLHRMTHYKFEGYMGEKRKRLVEKYGYDTKNASHLIRLLKMGIEFFVEGRLYPTRKHDATYLLEIKNGEYTLEQVKAEAERLFRSIEDAYIKSDLPAEPDRDKINQLAVEVVAMALGERE